MRLPLANSIQFSLAICAVGVALTVVWSLPVSISFELVIFASTVRVEIAGLSAVEVLSRRRRDCSRFPDNTKYLMLTFHRWMRGSLCRAQSDYFGGVGLVASVIVAAAARQAAARA